MKTKRPKLPKGKGRSKVLQIRLTAEEMALVERLAQEEGLEASRWARAALLPLYQVFVDGVCVLETQDRSRALRELANRQYHAALGIGGPTWLSLEIR